LGLQNAQLLQSLSEHVPSASLASALEQAETMHTAHQGELALHVAAERRSSAEIARLNAEVCTLLEQIASLHEETDKLKAQLASSSSSNSQLQLGTQELMAENSALTLMAVQARAEIDRLQ
jgi:hypothetical protein